MGAAKVLLALIACGAPAKVDGGVQGVSSFAIEVTAESFVVGGVLYPRRVSWRGSVANHMQPAIATVDGVTCFSNVQQLDAGGEYDCGNCQDEVCVDDHGLVELEADLVASEGPYRRRSARK